MSNGADVMQQSSSKYPQNLLMKMSGESVHLYEGYGKMTHSASNLWLQFFISLQIMAHKHFQSFDEYVDDQPEQNE